MQNNKKELNKSSTDRKKKARELLKIIETKARLHAKRVRSTQRRKKREKKVKLNWLLIELCNSSRRAVMVS